MAWLSKCRAFLIRYEKRASNYIGLIQLACALLWYRRQNRLLFRDRFLARRVGRDFLSGSLGKTGRDAVLPDDLACGVNVPVQVAGGADQGQVGKGLREVAQPFAAVTGFLSVKTQVVGVA